MGLSDEEFLQVVCDGAFSKYDGDDDGQLERNELFAFLEGVGLFTSPDELIRTLAKFRLHKKPLFDKAESLQVRIHDVKGARGGLRETPLYMYIGCRRHPQAQVLKPWLTEFGGSVFFTSWAEETDWSDVWMVGWYGESVDTFRDCSQVILRARELLGPCKEDRRGRGLGGIGNQR